MHQCHGRLLACSVVAAMSLKQETPTAGRSRWNNYKSKHRECARLTSHMVPHPQHRELSVANKAYYSYVHSCMGSIVHAVRDMRPVVGE